MRKYPISIFIPIYNFNPNELVKNVAKTHAFAEVNYEKFEIIIVDDSSKKETREAMLEAAKLGNINIIHYKNGPSRRENLAASFIKAENDVICFMDIDLSTELKYLLSLTDKVNEGYDIVIGSRYQGIDPERERYRFILSKLYNFSLRILFGSKIKDHTCGFKGFRKDTICKLVKKLDYDKTGKRGWFWDAEMLIRAQKENYKVIEIPVKWTRGAESTFSFGRESKLIPYLTSFWFKLYFGKR